MVTGKTRENIPVSGEYCCKDHPAVKSYLVKDDQFPHCKADDVHETIWELKEKKEETDSQEKSGAEKEEDRGKDRSNDQEGVSNKAASEKKESGKKEDDNRDAAEQVLLEMIYKKKGFFAALNQKNYPDLAEYRLQEVVRSEETVLLKEMGEMEEKVTARLNIMREEFENLKKLIEEKGDIKKEFVESLDTMQAECDTIRNEIKGYYNQLRQEIKSLGTSKEDLITKRIEKFETEINKMVGIYQKVERDQNTKFKTDFDNRSIEEKDKKFYYDYRSKLESSFSDVQKRVQTLEREGLNLVISRFLIVIGWIAAFISGWFFVLWREGESQSGSGLVIYILDKLRSFSLKFGWWQTLLFFLGYIIIVMIIAKYCYKWSIAAKFIEGKNAKKGNTEGDHIEFNSDKEALIKSQFKATNWFEMWLKLTPFISIVFLLIIILALGSQPEGDKDTYQKLSDSSLLELVGFLLPIAFTGLIFLYITKVIEARVMIGEEDAAKNTPRKKAPFSWEILLAVLFFLMLICLLIFNNTIQGLTINQIGAFGFFIGSLCAGLALGYGYRFISLNESFNILVDRIHYVNIYIERNFYPFETSYLKDGGILHRMKILYHSLLDLTQSRNNMAARLLNPHFKVEQHEKYEKKDSKGPEEPQEGENEEEQPKESVEQDEKGNLVKQFFNKIGEAFKAQERKWKERVKEKDSKIKGLEEEIADLKKDSIDIDELTYFPEVAAKIKELKTLIEERNKRLCELKEELEGYFKDQKTYRSINQQIENLYARKATLAQSIESIEKEVLEKKKKGTWELLKRKILIEEGYNLGRWYTGLSNDMENSSTNNN